MTVENAVPASMPEQDEQNLTDKNTKTKRDKFKGLAEARVQTITKSIGVLAGLSSRKNYDYTDEDVDKIFKYLNDELRKCRDKFDKKQFSFD